MMLTKAEAYVPVHIDDHDRVPRGRLLIDIDGEIILGMHSGPIAEQLLELVGDGKILEIYIAVKESE